jgi:hypothetical protein
VTIKKVTDRDPIQRTIAILAWKKTRTTWRNSVRTIGKLIDIRLRLRVFIQSNGKLFRALIWTPRVEQTRLSGGKSPHFLKLDTTRTWRVSFIHQTHYAQVNSPNCALDMKQFGSRNWPQSCKNYKEPCRCRESNSKLPLPAACSLVRLITQLSQPRACLCTSADSIVSSPMSVFHILYFPDCPFISVCCFRYSKLMSR